MSRPMGSGEGSSESRGGLLANLVAFAGLLRRSGVPVGSGQVLAAARALGAVGLGRRGDVYWALHATWISRPEDTPLFELAFRRFWRDPDTPADPLDVLPPDRLGERRHDPPPGQRRVREAWEKPGSRRAGPRQEEAHDAPAASWSADEVLRSKDFEQMSEDELRRARRAIAHMDLRVDPLPTRRYRAHAWGRSVDPRATLRAALRGGGYPARIIRRRPGERRPALVALCDISGSMDVYARMMLHFLHALTEEWQRSHTFLFGTRLTNVTRLLRGKDVDAALFAISRSVEDWSGGTRIGQALQSFNRAWSRRVLGQGAVVILVTDGLDRGDLEILRREVERLRRSCRRLIWLNPLLRYRAFEPLAGGVRTILPRVDDFRPVHDLTSLEELVRSLGGQGPARAASGVSREHPHGPRQPGIGRGRDLPST